jgi:hypothetical protein
VTSEIALIRRSHGLVGPVPSNVWADDIFVK